MFIFYIWSNFLVVSKFVYIKLWMIGTAEFGTTSSCYNTYFIYKLWIWWIALRQNNIWRHPNFHALSLLKDIERTIIIVIIATIDGRKMMMIFHRLSQKKICGEFARGWYLFGWLLNSLWFNLYWPNLDKSRRKILHYWFSGKIQRCHRWAPSSILG